MPEPLLPKTQGAASWQRQVLHYVCGFPAFAEKDQGHCVQAETLHYFAAEFLFTVLLTSRGARVERHSRSELPRVHLVSFKYCQALLVVNETAVF